MNEQLNRIEAQISAIVALISQQQKDIRKIQKWIAMKERKPRIKQATATITAPSSYLEYPDMSITLNAKTWMDIRKGKQVTLKGQGWPLDDEDTSQDFWSFNESGQATVRVYFPDPDNEDELFTDTIFNGLLRECDVEESPVQKHKAGATQQKPPRNA